MLKDIKTADVIALSLVGSMIAMAFVLAIRSPDSDIFKMLMGGLVTVGFASIIGFYFGSSSGSKAKDDTLNAIAQTATTTTANVTNGVTTSTGTHP